MLLVTGVPVWLGRLFAGPPLAWWPWTVAGGLALGARWPLGWTALAGWLALAWWYGRWQFARSLRFDARARRAGEYAAGERPAWMDRFFRWPAVVFRDPMAAMVEKELRSLARTPRFRLVFLMGFTFGPLIWMPMSLGHGMQADSLLVTNYLTLVSAYALILLGDVTFWNALGLDRSAAQLYYLLPAPFGRILAAKNLAAVFVVLVEVTAVTLACLALRMPFSGREDRRSVRGDLGAEPLPAGHGQPQLGLLSGGRSLRANLAPQFGGALPRVAGSVLYPVAAAPV